MAESMDNASDSSDAMDHGEVAATANAAANGDAQNDTVKIDIDLLMKEAAQAISSKKFTPQDGWSDDKVVGLMGKLIELASLGTKERMFIMQRQYMFVRLVMLCLERRTDSIILVSCRAIKAICHKETQHRLTFWKEKSTLVAIFEEGLKVDSELQHVSLCEALAELCLETKAFRDGFTAVPLVLGIADVLHKGRKNVDVVKQACNALCNLCFQASAHCEHIGQGGHHRVVSSLLRSYDRTDHCKDVLPCLLKLLTILHQDARVKLWLKEDQQLQLFMEVFKNNARSPVIAEATCTLLKALTDKENNTTWISVALNSVLIQLGLVDCIVIVLSLGFGTSLNKSLAKRCLQLLYNVCLTAQEEVQATIVKSSGVEDDEGKSLVSALCKVMDLYKRSTFILMISFHVLSLVFSPDTASQFNTIVDAAVCQERFEACKKAAQSHPEKADNLTRAYERFRAVTKGLVKGMEREQSAVVPVPVRVPTPLKGMEREGSSTVCVPGRLRNVQLSIPLDVFCKTPIAKNIFLKAVNEGSVRIRRLRVSICGQHGVGKTSLKKTILNEKFNPHEPSTEGIKFDEFARIIQQLKDNPDVMNDSESDKLQVSIWDFAGQAVYYAIHHLFMSYVRIIYLLVFKVNETYLGQDQGMDRGFLQMAPSIFRGNFQEKSCEVNSGMTDFDYILQWLSAIHYAGKRIDGGSSKPKVQPPVVVVATHADKAPSLTKDDLYTRLSKLCIGIEAFKHVDMFEQASESTGVHLINNTLSGKESVPSEEAQHLRNHISHLATELLSPENEDEIPKKWLRFEKSLKTLLNGKPKVPWLKLEQARKLIKDVCEVDDREEQLVLLSFYHSLGLVVHFQKPEGLGNTVILDVQWLISQLAKVITVKFISDAPAKEQDHWIRLEEDGELSKELTEMVWKDDLTPDMQTQLIGIMKEFDLLCDGSYGDGDADKKPFYFVPSVIQRESNANEFITKPLDNDEAIVVSMHEVPLVIQSSDQVMPIPHSLYFRVVVRLLRDWKRVHLKYNCVRFRYCDEEDDSGEFEVVLCYNAHAGTIKVVVQWLVLKTDSPSEDETYLRGKSHRMADVCNKVRKRAFNCLNTVRQPAMLQLTFKACVAVPCQNCRRCRKHKVLHCKKKLCAETMPKCDRHKTHLCCDELCAKKVCAALCEVKVSSSRAAPVCGNCKQRTPFPKNARCWVSPNEPYTFPDGFFSFAEEDVEPAAKLLCSAVTMAVGDSVLLGIAEGFSKRLECKKLAAHLGVSLGFVDRQLNSSQEIDEVAYTLMDEWRKQKGNKATGMELHKALIGMKRTDLADKFESDLCSRGDDAPDGNIVDAVEVDAPAASPGNCSQQILSSMPAASGVAARASPAELESQPDSQKFASEVTQDGQTGMTIDDFCTTPEGRDIFFNALSEGSIRVRRLTVNICGQFGVGKTSVKKTILNEDFNKEEKSTERMEVHQTRCILSGTTCDEWVQVEDEGVTLDEKSDRFVKVKVAMHDLERWEEERTKERNHLEETKALLEKPQELHEPKHRQEMLSQTQHVNSPDNILTSADEEVVNTDIYQPSLSDLPSLLEHDPQDQQPDYDLELCLEAATEAGHEIDEDELVILIQQLKDNPNVMAESKHDNLQITICDFAGQSIYYSIQHLFLAYVRTIYLLVFKVNEKYTDDMMANGFLQKTASRPDSREEMELCHINTDMTDFDYILQWLSTIHYVGRELNNETAKVKVQPPVVVVATHADKAPESLTRESLHEHLEDLCQNVSAFEHVTEVHLIDNTKSGKGKTPCKKAQGLRNHISYLAKELLPTENEDKIVEIDDKIVEKGVMPRKWLRFEKSLKELKKRKIRWLALDKVCKLINDVCEVSNSKEQLILLSFYHNLGLLVHFQEDKDLCSTVFLDVQWLISELCKVIPDRSNTTWIQQAYWKRLWKKLKENGELSKKLIEKIWPGESEKNVRQMIVQVMKRLDLLCEGSSDGEDDFYFVPFVLRHESDTDTFIRAPLCDQNTIVLSMHTVPLVIKSAEKRMPIPHSLFFRLVVRLLKKEWKRVELKYNCVRLRYKDDLEFADEFQVVLCHNAPAGTMKVIVQWEVFKQDVESKEYFTTNQWRMTEICNRVNEKVFECLGEVLQHPKLHLNFVRSLAFPCTAGCRKDSTDDVIDSRQHASSEDMPNCKRHKRRLCSDELCAKDVYAELQDLNQWSSSKAGPPCWNCSRPCRLPTNGRCWVNREQYFQVDEPGFLFASVDRKGVDGRTGDCMSVDATSFNMPGGSVCASKHGKMPSSPSSDVFDDEVRGEDIPYLPCQLIHDKIEDGVTELRLAGVSARYSAGALPVNTDICMMVRPIKQHYSFNSATFSPEVIVGPHLGNRLVKPLTLTFPLKLQGRVTALVSKTAAKDPPQWQVISERLINTFEDRGLVEVTAYEHCRYQVQSGQWVINVLPSFVYFSVFAKLQKNTHHLKLLCSNNRDLCKKPHGDFHLCHNQEDIIKVEVINGDEICLSMVSDDESITQLSSPFTEERHRHALDEQFSLCVEEKQQCSQSQKVRPSAAQSSYWQSEEREFFWRFQLPEGYGEGYVRAYSEQLKKVDGTPCSRQQSSELIYAISSPERCKQLPGGHAIPGNRTEEASLTSSKDSTSFQSDSTAIRCSTKTAQGKEPKQDSAATSSTKETGQGKEIKKEDLHLFKEIADWFTLMEDVYDLADDLLRGIGKVCGRDWVKGRKAEGGMQTPEVQARDVLERWYKRSPDKPYGRKLYDVLQGILPRAAEAVGAGLLCED